MITSFAEANPDIEVVVCRLAGGGGGGGSRGGRGGGGRGGARFT